MAVGIKLNEQVYVPVASAGLDPESGPAIVRGKVVAHEGRKIQVEILDPSSSRKGASRERLVSPPLGVHLAHRNLGVLVVRIGDLDDGSETTLLSPLAHAVYSYLQLLLPDDQVRMLELRTIQELQTFWAKNSESYTHVILIGHGAKEPATIQFLDGDNGGITGEQLGNVLRRQSADQAIIFSACCHSGIAQFGSDFSSRSRAKAYIAPTSTVHGALVAPLICTFFGNHFLRGYGVKASLRHACESIPNTSMFTMWSKGQLIE